MPFFDENNHPVQVKAGLSALLAMLVTGTAGASVAETNPLAWGTAEFLWITVCEFGVGAVLGLTANLVVRGVEGAGNLIDHSIGLGIANVIDPNRDIEVSLLSQFKMMFFLAVLVGIDGHHVFVASVARSYEVVPMRGLSISWPLVQRLASGVSHLLLVGVELAAPVVAASLLAHLILGFLGRTMPQMNIFVIGFPIQILLGFGVLLMMVSMMLGVAELLSSRSRSELDAVLHLMRPQT
jgi:flagellar biosynthetic protein FliR